MSSYDFFEMTGIAFDIAEKEPNFKVVKAAIEKTEKDLGSMLGRETQDTKKKDLNRKLLFLREMKKSLLTAEGKVNVSKFKEIAQIKLEKQKESLEAELMLTQYGNTELIITNGTVKAKKREYGLSEKSIREVYKSNGYSIKELKPLEAMPKFPGMAKKIHSELEQFRKIEDPNPEGKDRSKVTDIYAFIAYISDEPENTAEYREHRLDKREEYKGILDEYAKKYAMIGDGTIGKKGNEIASLAKIYIFNSEENIKAYDNYLLYLNPMLQDMFSKLKKITLKSQLKKEEFAEHCIDVIFRVFRDKETALAIYNYEAGLKDDPYYSTDSTFNIMCVPCGNVNKFSSEDEAKVQNQCKACGRKLYKKCSNPGCGQWVLAYLDKCPECGYAFANAVMFAKYIGLAEDALKKENLEDAKAFIVKAKIAAPGETARTGVLEKQIEVEEKKYAEPLRKLRGLISVKRFNAALSYMDSIAAQYPSMNISEQKRITQDTLRRCRKLFESVTLSADRTVQISVALDILDMCVDFEPAIDCLRTIPPAACGGLSCIADNRKGHMLLTWENPDERGVKFRLVRKEGSVPPKNVLDGKVVADEYEELMYVDNDITPGVFYTYSLFTQRMGLFSRAVSAGAAALVTVSDIEYVQKGNRMLLSWKLPDNCDFVTVTKVVKGKESVISAVAKNSAEDTNLEFNQPHVYYFAANYREMGKSDRECISVTPTVTIDTFNISVKKSRKHLYDVTWNILQDGVDLQIFVNGELRKQLRSDIQHCLIELQDNNFFRIQVKAFSGGAWIESRNVMDINTYRPCEFDADLEEKSFGTTEGIVRKVELSFRVKGDIPEGVSELLYFVRTKEELSKPAPWVDEDEAGNAPDACRMGIDTYKKHQKIVYSLLAKDEEAYYVTFFALYKLHGKTILSAPGHKRLNRSLKADLFWKVTKNIFGEKRLQMEIKANRPFARLPGLVLCVSSDGRHLFSPNDNTAVHILKIPERTNENYYTSRKDIYDITEEIHKNQKLFLFEERPLVNEEFTLRWANGFGGKV